METVTNFSQNTPDISAQLAASREEVAQLKHELQWLKRQLFGVKSEKQVIDNPGQASLFVIDATDVAKGSPKKYIQAHTRSSKKQNNEDDVHDSGLRFSHDVPQQIIDVPSPELAGKNADQYEIMGVKETRRLAQQPGSYMILVYRRQVLRHKSEQTLKETPAPTNVLEGCYADVSLLAGLMVDKTVYHLPLHRQHQRMLDAGITISRATLTGYVKKGIELLRPIERAQWCNILSGSDIAMDEVPMKAGRVNTASRKTSKMKQTYFWPIYGEQDEVAFTWSKSRGMAHAMEQLQGFNGTLLTDGYSAYTSVVKKLNQQDQNITHASCWAHLRRMFEKALDAAPEEAQLALDMIAKLYQVEAYIREKCMAADDITSTRGKHSEPIITELFNWIYEQRQRLDLLPKHPLTKALNYTHNRHDQMKVYLTHPQVAIDTNHLERALRVIPMGRKNHLFCWTELGAEQLGILHSLTVTCRLHDINPYHYLVDVLQRVAQHPAKDVMALTPRCWKVRFADKRLRSDVEYTSSEEK
jgi:transposase